MGLAARPGCSPGRAPCSLCTSEWGSRISIMDSSFVSDDIGGIPSVPPGSRSISDHCRRQLRPRGIKSKARAKRTCAAQDPPRPRKSRRPHVAVCGFTQFMCGPAPKCLPPGLSDFGVILASPKAASRRPCGRDVWGLAPRCHASAGYWTGRMSAERAGADRGGPMSQTEVERTLGGVLADAFRQSACLLLGVQLAPHELEALLRMPRRRLGTLSAELDDRIWSAP